jgi:hypothetical protein
MWARENAASANRHVSLLAAPSGAIPLIEAGRNLGGHIVYEEAGSPAR